MHITIAKFGGSTTNNRNKLNVACSTVTSFVENKEKVVVVVSALRGVTNTLEATIRTINEENFHESITQCNNQLRRLHEHAPLDPRDLSELETQFQLLVQSGKSPWLQDQILVKGEELFSTNFATELTNRGIKTKLLTFDSPKFPTMVHGYFGNARVDLAQTKIKCETLASCFEEYVCLCVPGYGGVDIESGRVKTLRRGGSDAVATALSYGFSAAALWIITDVNGIQRVYTKKIVDAPTIPELCVEELRDAGTYGAKVPNEVAVRPLMLHCPPVTFVAKYDELDGEKTRIVKNEGTDSGRVVELAAQRELIIYEFTGVNIHATLSQLESELDAHFIDFISLGGGDYTRKIVIPPDQAPYMDQCVTTCGEKIDITKSKSSIVGIVGKNMRKTPGIIAKMGSALAKKDINIYYQFDVSPISCGVIVERSQAEAAVELLYREFKLATH